MPSRHAAACGISIGLLTGIAIAMCLNLDVVDAAYRITVLAACGAWMGILLTCLNDLLSSPQSRNSGHWK